MKKIALGKKATKHTGMFALVDDEDFKELNKYNWHARYDKTTNSFYAARTYPDEHRKQHRIFMHHQIMKPSKGKLLDHTHHNTLDNRKKHMRFVTQSQSLMNRRKCKPHTSRYKGVSKVVMKSGNLRWKAQINANNEVGYLGLFEYTEAGEIKAAKAYDKKAGELHKEHACLNFPQEGENGRR